MFNILKEHGFDAKKVKTARIKIPNATYLVDNELVKGPILPRIVDLNEIPSVFENNLSDKFFDKHLIPMIQTARGCPYSCTFCHEGSLYFNKTRRFSQERVEWELNYISKRVKVPDFIIVDLNFGLFKEDIDTAKYMAEMQEQYDWPKFVTIATAKNHKQRVLEISKILHGSLPPGAAVQSTDPEVLKIIKRKNLPMEAVVEVAKTAETDGAASFSEIILCLPGDSKRAYFKSVKDVIDAGFTLVRTYQFMLLAGTEAGGTAARKEFDYVTRFRVKPMNFGIYTFRGERFPSAEIEEICVSNKTMSYEDYRACREMSLTIEIFNNNGIFYDFVQFLDKLGISRANFLMRIHDIVKNDDLVYGFYTDFAKEEEKNLWLDQEKLRDFTNQPSVLEKYIAAEYGTNEIYKYRAIAVFQHMEALHRIAFQAAQQLLQEHHTAPAEAAHYLTELTQFSLLRKQTLFAMDKRSTATFHFDFVRLLDSNFGLHPLEAACPEGVEIEILHTQKQQQLIAGYTDQFGTDLIGLGRILNRAHIAAMYRSAHYSGVEAERRNKQRRVRELSVERATAGPTGGDMIEQY
ncbi:MAG: hypothetical protein A3F41_04035 [Coxiella sp. RIFCSPHIGHO2_12_FULL_44_14]|nr:MAG: hypothetical protein A3F41_04035 [Coxiella sp. RIFCSPHIGHO2_12_FULL_44_14]